MGGVPLETCLEAEGDNLKTHRPPGFRASGWGRWAWAKHQALVLGSWGPRGSAEAGGTLAPVTLGG